MMAVALILAACYSADLADACQICTPHPLEMGGAGTPVKTDVDYLIQSRTAILAREDPQKPYTYAPVEILKGHIGNTPINLFLNTAIRRRLAADKQSAVLIVHPQAGQKWRRLGIVDAEYQALMRRIVQLSPLWQTNATYNKHRLAFFARLLGHENRRIHILACSEVSQAPYNMIKLLAHVWPRGAVWASLKEKLDTRCHALGIMTLAHRGHPDDLAFIARSFDDAWRSKATTNLSALAASQIEIEGIAGITKIENRYFRPTDRKLEEVVAVFTALSVHGGAGTIHLRDRIVQSYTILLENYPDMAGYVARDLAAWRLWTLADELAEILRERETSDPLTAQAIKEFLDLSFIAYPILPAPPTQHKERRQK
jgi:hypothetical protein